MNLNEVKREIELLEDNLLYIDELKELINSEYLMSIKYKKKNSSRYPNHNLINSWYEMEDEIKEVFKKEVKRTEESIDGIIERLGFEKEKLLKEFVK